MGGDPTRHIPHDMGPERAYAEAWDEWNSTGEATRWDATVADGISDTQGRD